MSHAWRRFALACLSTFYVLFALPLSAAAQGQNPRCPEAPLRFPSGNWIWFAYAPGVHTGLDLVDVNLANPQPIGPNSSFPQNVIPVYSPITGNLTNVGWLWGFYGSVLITGTLDSVWQGRVPTRDIRIWLTHMADAAQTVSYVMRPSGPINEGDLIGYQGTAGTAPTHLHFGIYDNNVPLGSSSWAGVLDPTPYVNADVNRSDSNTWANFPIPCHATPRGTIDWPLYNGVVNKPLYVAGYAIDSSAQNGTGIDQVELYLDGYAQSSGISIGSPAYGSARPDVAAYYGSWFRDSGFTFTWYPPLSFSVGRHSIALYAHQISTGTWGLLDVRYFYAPFRFTNFLPFTHR